MVDGVDYVPIICRSSCTHRSGIEMFPISYVSIFYGNRRLTSLKPSRVGIRFRRYNRLQQSYAVGQSFLFSGFFSFNFFVTLSFILLNGVSPWILCQLVDLYFII